jgi:hypothetical protein
MPDALELLKTRRSVKPMELAGTGTGSGRGRDAVENRITGPLITAS